MVVHKLEPEIAGEIGDNSIIQYENGKISKIKFLEFRFNDWLGDELIGTHPCYIITENLKIDGFGNVWKKGPSRTAGEAFEWDVQLSKKGIEQVGWLSRDNAHINVSLEGEITHR